MICQPDRIEVIYMSSQFKHPYVLAPNRDMGDYLCSIFSIPRNYIRTGVPDSLRGFGKDAVFILYTEGWEENTMNEIMDVLILSKCTINSVS